MVIALLNFISNSSNADLPQKGNRKAKAMSSGPRHYDRVYKADKHQEPDAAEQEVNAIGRCKMDITAETCCSGKNWRLLSRTRQLCDVKVFNNSYEVITNVPVGRAATAVVHDDGTV